MDWTGISRRDIFRGAGALAAAAPAWGAACDPSRAATLERVRIGVPSQIGPTGKPELGTAVGYIDHVVQPDLRAMGLGVEWVPVPGAGPGINEALAGGTVDLAYYGDFPAIIGRAGNLKIKLILGGKRGSNSYLVVPPGSSARSITDLKGKRIAINKGRPWMVAFSRLLHTNGLAERDFEIFNLSPGDATAAMVSGNLEAVYQPQPFGYSLEQKGIGKIIWSTRNETLKDKFTIDLFALESFVAAHPDVMQTIVTGFVKAAHYASLPENRDEIIKENVTAGASLGVIQSEYDTYPFRDVIIPTIDAYLRAHYRDTVAYMVEQRMIRREVAVDDLIDSRFVDSALASTGWANYWPRADASGRPEAPGQ